MRYEARRSPCAATSDPVSCGSQRLSPPAAQRAFSFRDTRSCRLPTELLLTVRLTKQTIPSLADLKGSHLLPINVRFLRDPSSCPRSKARCSPCGDKNDPVSCGSQEFSPLAAQRAFLRDPRSYPRPTASGSLCAYRKQTTIPFLADLKGLSPLAAQRASLAH